MKKILIVLITAIVALSAYADEIRFSEEYEDDLELLESSLKESDDHQCMEKTKRAFSLYDYSVVIAMLAVSLKIGVFYGFFHKSSSNSEDFMLGSKMGLFPVTLSLTTSFVTAIELLGNPAEMFFHGTQFSLIGNYLNGSRYSGCHQGVRFGKEMRLMGGTLYIIQMCFYTSVSVLAPAIALSKATGLNTRLAIVLIYVVCIFYSSQGGLKAVVIADTFQACILFISLILIVCFGTFYQKGGFSQVIEIAKENERLELWNLDTNPQTRHSVFSVIIGGFFYWTSLLCVNQATVQKAMSLKSLSKARIALALSIFGLVTVFIVNFYTGLLAFAKYEKCDPLKSGQIDAIDQLMPFFVMDVFGHIKFIVGIFVAGIFAASLGTVAACLSSLSAVTMEDILITGLNLKITPQKGSSYAKWMSVGYGIFSFGLIFLVEGRGVLQATLTLNGLVGGILLGLFSLGIFFKKANAKGAFFGGIIAIACVTVLGIISQFVNTETPFLDSSVSGCGCAVNVTSSTNLVEEHESKGWLLNIFGVSYMFYSMIGTLLTIFFGLVISLISDEHERVDTLRVSSSQDFHKDFHLHDRFSVASFTLATGRKLTSFIHHVAHDVSQSTLKVENKLKEVISHSNLHHLHHGIIHSDAEERISILNEENGEEDECVSLLKSRPDKMFFIGHDDDEKID
ncbi:CLUMA_CG013423, isoform A [Clunio marinus]|uniref:CLUMA_CG013423, isoform A n=1 Tax=Clunio marinus TaxID=568069 RepID=A0A1J1IIU8_9DIPT|nr:CLUMA_CG013423, isoform A [Clunio marinus]